MLIHNSEIDVAMQQLWAAGFNAFEQLLVTSEAEPDDVFAFRKVAEGNSIQVIQPDGCSTYVKVDGALRVLGLSVVRPSESDISRMFDKLLAVNAAGHILLADHADQSVSGSESDAKCTLNLYLNSQDRRDESPQRTWPLDLRVRQVTAWDTGFVILLEDGELRTMGDARYGMCLGRVPPNAGQSWEPDFLPDLQSLGEGFVQIASGSYTIAALTESGSVYIWGMNTDGAYRRPQPFAAIDMMPNYIEVDEGRDVAKIDIGDSHAICLSTEGIVYVIGGNDNGQLGLGRLPRDRAREWVKVANSDLMSGRKIVDVYAGPRASFIITTNCRTTKDAA